MLCINTINIISKHTIRYKSKRIKYYNLFFYFNSLLSNTHPLVTHKNTSLINSLKIIFLQLNLNFSKYFRFKSIFINFFKYLIFNKKIPFLKLPLLLNSNILTLPLKINTYHLNKYCVGVKYFLNYKSFNIVPIELNLISKTIPSIIICLILVCV
jgi:hypothetical protein